MIFMIDTFGCLSFGSILNCKFDLTFRCMLLELKVDSASVFDGRNVVPRFHACVFGASVAVKGVEYHRDLDLHFVVSADC